MLSDRFLKKKRLTLYTYRIHDFSRTQGPPGWSCPPRKSVERSRGSCDPGLILSYIRVRVIKHLKKIFRSKSGYKSLQKNLYEYFEDN